nr:protein FAR-RED IMPAIRED RESPONSE 1-like [Coffea arabica]
MYYAVDLGNKKEKRMQNVVWIDPKGRNDYEHFFDVVFFDTSYLGKGYTLPFLPVVGVNHHSQHILLGGALIGDDLLCLFFCLVDAHLAKSLAAEKLKMLDASKEYILQISYFLKGCKKHARPSCLSVEHFNSILTQVGHYASQQSTELRNMDLCGFVSQNVS